MISVCVGDIIEAQFVKRVNRFTCNVKVNDEIREAHLHDPGRLTELLLPGSKILLREENAPHRRTQYDMVGVYAGTTVVSLDTRVPNKLVGEALRENALPELPPYTTVIPEYTYGHSRIDFCLDERILIEVKGVSLVRDGVAFFPDAPTERGRKHLDTLIQALSKFECSIFFLVQRPDAFTFSVNEETDPAFASTLRKARAKGVNILVYTSALVGNYVYLREKLFPIT